MKRTWRNSLAAALTLGPALLTGCGGTGLPENVAVQNRLELKSFESCEDLEAYIEDTAVLQMKASIEEQKRYARGDYSHGGVAMGGDARGAAETTGAPQAAGADMAAGANSAPQDYTTTNTQVAGVDEADFVKNDGTRIFVLTGNKLYLNKSWPANEAATVATMDVEGWPREMFLDDKNRLVLFSTVYRDYALKDSYEDNGRIGMGALAACYSYGNATKVTVVDVSTLSAPKVTAEYFFSGDYRNARRVGASVRVVLGDHFRYPKGVQFYPDYEQGLYEDKGRLIAKLDALQKENEGKIRETSLDSWLPQAARKVGANVESLPNVCQSYHRSNAPHRLGLATVLTLNLDAPTQAPSRTSVVAEVGEIYANDKSLYLANTHWWWWPSPGQTDHTYLYKFDISKPDVATYVAAGGVAGHILDQFSMDEHQGFLRVATTINNRVPELGNDWGRLETVSRVSVLREDEGVLHLHGKTADLAPGERIFSSRFFGGKGYVVTFRQVDPLFTIDLSDPANPRQVGALKIPGFSTYLHPLDENHLLSIGQHQSENGDWQTRAVKLTVFDVSDFANPKEKFTQLVGTSYGWSEAQYQHKAFNYFPAKKLLAIPFSDYRNVQGQDYWQNFTTDLRLFNIDTTTGITPRGSLSMKDVYQTSTHYNWTWYWTPAVRRSVLADDFVYAISDAGLRVANIHNLSTPLATLRFDRGT